MIYLNIFIISVVISYCLDVSGFWDSASSIVSGWLTNGQVKKPFYIKPFSCPLCLTFWVGLVYIIVAGFTLPLLLWVCVCSWLTSIYPLVFHFVEAFIFKLFNELGEYFNLQ